MVRRLAIAAALAFAGAFVHPSMACAGLSLSVQPLTSELRVNPGASGGVSVRVQNAGDQPERVAVEPIDWSTTIDGDIKFGNVGSQHANSITKYLAMSLVPFVLAPGESRVIPLTLRLPASFPSAAATYWGGFLVRGTPVEKLGMGPAATVFIYNTVGAPKTHLKLTSLRATPSGTVGTVLSARLNNDSAGFARLTGRLVITSSAGRIVHDEDVSTTTIFPGESRVITRDLKGLAPGNYQAELSLDYGGDVLLSGTTEFRVK